MAEKRKTINGEDLIKAMRELSFDQYMPHVEYYNKKYKETLRETLAKNDPSVVDTLDDGPFGEITDLEEIKDNL